VSETWNGKFWGPRSNSRGNPRKRNADPWGGLAGTELLRRKLAVGQCNRKTKSPLEKGWQQVLSN